MFGFMVTADGGLTTAGYVITIIAGIILFFLAIYFAGKNSDKKKLTTRQLVFCAVAIALAFITSYLKIFKLPWGGSVTLCSMLFIVLIANWYGVGTGIMAGFAYGILQFIQEPYVLSFFQQDDFRCFVRTSDTGCSSSSSCYASNNNNLHLNIFSF